MEDKNKRLTYEIYENTSEASCREKIQSNNPATTIGDADKNESSSNVSCCEQTRSNALSSTSPTVIKSEKDQHNLDERTTIIGLKSSSDSKTDRDNLDDGITNV